MSKLTERITELLKQETLESSLTRDALTGMLDTISNLEKDIKLKTIELEQIQGQVGDLSLKLEDALKSNDKLTKELKAFKARETDLVEREKKQLRLEIENEFATKRGDEMLGIVTNLTRNTMVRQRLMGTENIPVQGGDSYSGFVDSRPIDKTVQKEEV